MVPLIDRDTGSINLTKEWILGPGLTVESLAHLIGNRLSGSDRDTRWFSHIIVDGRYGELDVTLVFASDALTSFKARMKIGYKDTEMAVKSRQDALLRQLLGNPTSERHIVSSEIVRTFFTAIRREWPKAAQELTWQFPWGRVLSTVESRDVVPEFWVEWKS